jgi:YggT family protein
MLHFYYYVVIGAVVLSLLIAFEVVPRRNEVVYMIGQSLNALTEPVFVRIRQYLPPTGGIDFSPLVVIFLLMFIEHVVIIGWLMPLF